MPDKGFETIQLKKSLRTRELLAEAVRLTPPDELGRKVPAYAVVDRAIKEHVKKLARTAKAKG